MQPSLRAGAVRRDEDGVVPGERADDLRRAGQRMPCTYIYLAAAGTVDEKVLKALKSKANLAKALVDDYRYGNNPFM